MGRSTMASNETNVARLGDVELPEHPDTLNGWRCADVDEHPEDESLPEYRGDLYVETYVGPNREMVFGVNASPYAAGGACDRVVFGPDREHVEALIKAFGFKNITIKPTAIVQQTI